MTFLKSELIIPLIIFIILFSSFIIYFETKYFSWIKDHWQYVRSTASKISKVLYILGISLLLTIVLDPREKEIKVKAPVRQAKTVILIDTSTSMLVEDVRPNRIERAALLAKHFARKASDHQISVMIFADITKKLVPFTNDRDLIDARIDSIKDIRNLNAGTSIEGSVAEAIRMFNLKDKSMSGNLLVITDGEDHGGEVNISVPDEIKVAFLGVGTPEGGSIPMKDIRGMFYGYKKDKAKTVISKLDKLYFEKAVNSKENRKYFEATLTGIPSDEIYDFFNSKNNEMTEGENVVRPLSLKRFAYPALFLLIMSYVFRMFKPFAITALIVFSSPSSSDEPPVELVERLEMLRNGELSKNEKINLADNLIKNKMHQPAHQVYEESFGSGDLAEYSSSYFNWATSLLENNDLEGALNKFQELEEHAEKNGNRDLLEKIRENIKRAFVQKSSKDKKSQKDKKEDKEQKKKEESGDGSSKDNQSGESGQSQDQKQNSQSDTKEEKNPFDPKNNEEESKKDSEGENDKNKKDKSDISPTPQDLGTESDKEKKNVKVPLLEQLKQDDRKLQLKLLDTSTQGGRNPKKKDW